jgi:hypothetical protein
MTAPYVTDWETIRELTRCLPPLTPAAHKIYLYIAGHVGAQGLCFPSIETLAAEAHLHPGTVRKARAELEEAGLIATTPGGGRRSNLYQLIDFRLSTPRAPRRGVTPRPTARHPAPHGAIPRAPRRGEEDLRRVEEGACACGRVCPPGKWRCTDCQDQVELGKAKLTAMLGADRVEQ